MPPCVGYRLCNRCAGLSATPLQWRASPARAANPFPRCAAVLRGETRTPIAAALGSGSGGRPRIHLATSAGDPTPPEPPEADHRSCSISKTLLRGKKAFSHSAGGTVCAGQHLPDLGPLPHGRHLHTDPRVVEERRRLPLEFPQRSDIVEILKAVVALRNNRQREHPLPQGCRQGCRTLYAAGPPTPAGEASEG